MKRYQPLVLQKLDIRIPGLHIRRLAVHRHLPETTNVSPHAHKFFQCLLYLSGRGVQKLGRLAHPVMAGTAVFLPPGIQHAFQREANRHPICLVLDFDWRGAKASSPRIALLPAATLHEVRQQLVRIMHRQRQPPARPPIQISVTVLSLLESLLTGFVLPDSSQGNTLSPVTRKLRRLLAAPHAVSLPLARLAQQVGYQQDYLNRLLKRHEGLTLGQMRARTLLARAQQLLPQSSSVAEVANALGFNDPNYFARWFHRLTGVSPSRWRQDASSR